MAFRSVTHSTARSSLLGTLEALLLTTLLFHCGWQSWSQTTSESRLLESSLLLSPGGQTPWQIVLVRTPGWGGRTHCRAFIRVVRSSPPWPWERWCSFPSSVESSGCVRARGGGRSLQHSLVSLPLSFPCTSFSVANRDWEKRDLTPSRMSGSRLTSSSPMSQAESRGAFSWIYHKPKPHEWLSPVEPK